MFIFYFLIPIVCLLFIFVLRWRSADSKYVSHRAEKIFLPKSATTKSTTKQKTPKASIRPEDDHLLYHMIQINRLLHPEAEKQSNETRVIATENDSHNKMKMVSQNMAEMMGVSKFSFLDDVIDQMAGYDDSEPAPEFKEQDMINLVMSTADHSIRNEKNEEMRKFKTGMRDMLQTFATAMMEGAEQLAICDEEIEQTLAATESTPVASSSTSGQSSQAVVTVDTTRPSIEQISQELDNYPCTCAQLANDAELCQRCQLIQMHEENLATERVINNMNSMMFELIRQKISQQGREEVTFEQFLARLPPKLMDHEIMHPSDFDKFSAWKKEHGQE